jgi:hypothetical protein
LGIINLKEARQKQIDKQNKLSKLMDPVLYATIERDYSELLDLVVRFASPLLVSQFVYFLNKSESQGRRDIEKMVELGLFGVNTWKGLSYLYPLKNAKVWCYKDPKQRAMRSDHKYDFLFDRFMLVERIIERDKRCLKTGYLEGLEDSIRIAYGPSEQRFRMEKEITDRPEFTTYEVLGNDKDKTAHFIKYAIKRLRKDIYFRNFRMKDQKLFIQALFVHREDMKPTDYYKRIKSLNYFADRFLDVERTIEVEVLTAHETDSNNALAYFEEGLKVFKRERVKGGSGGGKMDKDEKQDYGFKLTGVINLNFARRYQADEMHEEFLNYKEKNKIDKEICMIPE